MQVLTVTLNPALDREIIIEDFKVDKFHRVADYDHIAISPGGKGINVSIALATFNVPSIAIGFVGGYMGRILVEELRKISNLITTNFVFIRGDTRENIVIADPLNHTITEINSPGPLIDPKDVEHILRRYAMSLTRVRAVVISGSVPPNLDSDIYIKMVNLAKEKEIPVFMEVTDKHVTAFYNNGIMPFVIKPDLRARNVILGQEVNSVAEFVQMGKELIKMGAKLVILSYHVDRDIIITGDGAWLISPTVEVDFSHLLGTGDAYVAGMVYKYLEGEKDLLEIGKFGYITALAKTTKVKKEIPTLDEIEFFKDKYELEKVGS